MFSFKMPKISQMHTGAGLPPHLCVIQLISFPFDLWNRGSAPGREEKGVWGVLFQPVLALYLVVQTLKALKNLD